jgi:hypothetical protein
MPFGRHLRCVIIMLKQVVEHVLELAMATTNAPVQSRPIGVDLPRNVNGLQWCAGSIEGIHTRYLLLWVQVLKVSVAEPAKSPALNE